MITVFGSVNPDLVARVERLPRPGETLAGQAEELLERLPTSEPQRHFRPGAVLQFA
jgi:sugar/nucleoside kinase (ribokinase family)